MTDTLPKIKQVNLIQGPVYEAGPYAVYVGHVQNKDNSDIDHYLIVNTRFNVVEGSSPNFIQGREIADKLFMAESQQDKGDEVTGEDFGSTRSN